MRSYLFFHFHIRDARIQQRRARESVESGGKKHARTRDALGLLTSHERAFDIRVVSFGTIVFFFSSHTFRGRALTFFFRIFSGTEKNSQVRARERPSREPSREDAGSDHGVGVLHGLEEEGRE